MVSMTSRDAFAGFTFTAFSAKSIPVVVAVMISSFLIESSMFFFFSFFFYSFIVSSDLKHMTSFWFDRLFMDDLS